jgi:hypothetical protein
MSKSGFQLWWTGKMQGSELLPGIPPDAKLSPDTKVSPENRGKTPGKLTPKGWVGFADWTKFRAELEDVKCWHGWGANVLYQTRIFHFIDGDIDDARVSGAIED